MLSEADRRARLEAMRAPWITGEWAAPVPIEDDDDDPLDVEANGWVASDIPTRFPTDAGSPSHAEMELVAAVNGTSDEDLRDRFPDDDVSLDVAERIDDLVPDLARASLASVLEALQVVGRGIDRCAVLKRLASDPAFRPIERELLTRIRNQKATIHRARADLERRRDALQAEDEQWRDAGVERPTGFAAMFAKPGDAAEAKRRSDDRRRLQQETNDFVLKTHRDIMERRKKSWDKQHEDFLRLLQGRRY